MKIGPRYNKKGLTLIELLIAVAISSIVLVFVANFFIQGMKDTQSLAKYAGQQESVNQVVGYIRKDIEAAKSVYVKKNGANSLDNELVLVNKDGDKKYWRFEDGSLKRKADSNGASTPTPYTSMLGGLDTVLDYHDFNFDINTKKGDHCFFYLDKSESKVMVFIQTIKDNKISNTNRNEKQIIAEFSVRYKVLPTSAP